MIVAAHRAHRIVANRMKQRPFQQAGTESLVSPDEPEEPSELDDPTLPWPADDHWDVFLPDDDPYETLPEPGDFWIDFDE